MDDVNDTVLTIRHPDGASSGRQAQTSHKVCVRPRTYDVCEIGYFCAAQTIPSPTENRALRIESPNSDTFVTIDTILDFEPFSMGLNVFHLCNATGW